MENKLRVTCRGAGEIALHLLEPLQGELKTLSVENYEKMVKSFHEHGFSDPIRMWECPDDGKLYILDGHQRVRVLLQLKEQGWEIPQIPVDYVEASSLDEAKKKLLQIFVSQYGRVDIQGLYEFVSQTAITSDDLMQMDIPHVNIPEFIDGFMPETVTVDVREHERSINTNKGEIEIEAPTLPEGDKDTLKQVTFILTNSQHDVVLAALSKAKDAGEFTNTENENSNGNALERVCEKYVLS